MPALPTVVTDYLTAIKDALTTGPALGSDLNAAAQNYLRAQDMATVLDLLQDYGFTQSSVLTAVSGTVRTVVDGASTFVANTQIGNTVTFTGNTTAALAGVSRRVVRNTTISLTFEGDDLPAAPAVGDTYTIQGTMFQEFITALLESTTSNPKGLADAPAGSVYGGRRLAIGGIMKGVENLGSSVVERNVGRPGLLTAAGSTTTVVALVTAGVDYRIDELRGMRVTISGESSIVLRNTENTVTLRKALSSAPAASTAVAITVPTDDFGGTSAPKIRTHPGVQPGENAVLADLIDQLQVLVVAFTLPT